MMKRIVLTACLITLLVICACGEAPASTGNVIDSQVLQYEHDPEIRSGDKTTLITPTDLPDTPTPKIDEKPTPTELAEATATPTQAPTVTPTPGIEYFEMTLSTGKQTVKFTPVNEEVYIDAGALNLRFLPSTEGEVYHLSHYGEIYTRTGIGDIGWDRIIIDGKTCYCVAKYLTIYKGEVPVPTAEPTPTPKPTATPTPVPTATPVPTETPTPTPEAVG